MVNMSRVAAFAFAALLATFVPVQGDAATIDFSLTDLTNTPQIVGTLTGSGDVTISMKLLVDVTPEGGADGSIFVDLVNSPSLPGDTPVDTFFAISSPFDPETPLISFATFTETVLLSGPFSLDIVVTASITEAFGATFNGNPILRITLEETAAAVPLPAALPLFASGVVLMGYFGRRKRRRA